MYKLKKIAKRGLQAYSIKANLKDIKTVRYSTWN